MEARGGRELGRPDPIYLVETLFFVLAVLVVFGVAVAQWFEMRDMRLRYRLFRASDLLLSYSRPPASRTAAPRQSFSFSSNSAVRLGEGAPPDVPRIKVLLNRAVLATATVMLVRAVDVHGALGIYNATARDVLNNTTTAMIVSVALQLFFEQIVIGLKIMREKEPRGARAAVLGYIGSLFAVCYGTLLARVWTSSGLVGQGIFMFWTLAGLVGIFIEVNLGVARLRKAGRHYSSSSSVEIRRKLPVLADAISKLATTRLYASILCVVAGAAALARGLAAARSDDVQSAGALNLEEWKVGGNMAVWAKILALCVMLNFSWVPLGGSRRKAPAGGGGAGAQAGQRRSPLGAASGASSEERTG